jgi:glycosyltransferase involved in cell wall biosynthesis
MKISKLINQFFNTNKVGKPDSYNNWIQMKEPTKLIQEKMRNDVANFRNKPIISLICPVWNPDPDFLIAMLDSVEGQIYPNYELCICEAASKNYKIKEILKKYSYKNNKIKIDWADKNYGISGNSNRALKLATGEFIGLLDHDDTLAPHALFEIASLLNQKPNLSLIYTDEDKIDPDGYRVSPFFKPEWSPDLILSCGYINHLTVYRKYYLDKIDRKSTRLNSSH